MGYKWIDVSCMRWAPHVATDKLVWDFDNTCSKIASILEENKLAVSNFTFESIDSKKGPFSEYLAEFESLVSLAYELKVPLINIMAPKAGADWNACVKQLRILIQIASEKDIKLSVETHVGQVTEDPNKAIRLCEEVKGLGLTLDPSHLYAGPNQGKDFDYLYPYAYGTGLRAGGMNPDQLQLPWGEGPIDFRQVIAKLEASGYEGFYVAEYLEGYNSVDALKESRRFFDWVKAL